MDREPWLVSCFTHHDTKVDEMIISRLGVKVLDSFIGIKVPDSQSISILQFLSQHFLTWPYQEANPEKRLTASRVLRHEWIRRRWRPPAGANKVFEKIEDWNGTFAHTGALL